MSRAVRYSEFGDADVLQVVEVEKPQAGPGQVRVAVRAAGLNPYDYKVRRGEYGKVRPLPSGQGSEFAGTVDQLGPGITTVTVGQEVLGWTSFAAQAEYVLVPEDTLAPKPANLDWAVAGGIGLVGNTAKRATDALRLTPDDTVLVTAAAGGVGLLCVQFARSVGAAVVATASETNHEFLRGLGAIPVAYGVGQLERARAAAPAGYTAMLDSAGRDGVLLGLDLGIHPSRINSIAYQPGAEEFGISTIGGGKKTTAELAWLARSAAHGSLQFPIRATFPLDRVQDAYRLLEKRHGLGKIVLTMP